jgi:hypothetical protein
MWGMPEDKNIYSFIELTTHTHTHINIVIGSQNLYTEFNKYRRKFPHAFSPPPPLHVFDKGMKKLPKTWKTDCIFLFSRDKI